MRTQTLLLLLATVLACCKVAHASTDCDNPVTSTEVAECADRERAAAEQRLSAVYSQVLASLQRVDAEYLRSYPNHQPLRAAASLAAAQRAWLTFRRQSCHVEELVARSGNPSRGDTSAIADTTCESRLSSARAVELENLASSYDIALGEEPAASIARTGSGPRHRLPAAAHVER
ncbi:lysozyme inhibitor LprI family protein [Ralstonia pseudosolanacearum]|uniref:lysozyme inhibitor LprI family protein n=1 Tax=Ralstonia pseudosolanacearum TaxID=1310165 RepID=UPI001FF8FA6D|nr:lysozyme inhibitor LprI family protein [Ralstonia pseudosolanacearum]